MCVRGPLTIVDECLCGAAHALFVQESLELKEKVLQLERVLLQTIAFDLTVEHPYKYILNFVKKINGTAPQPNSSALHRQQFTCSLTHSLFSSPALQATETWPRPHGILSTTGAHSVRSPQCDSLPGLYLNSLLYFSLRTTLCLHYKPQLIATAAIYLASKMLAYELPSPWWELLDIKIEDVEGTHPPPPRRPLSSLPVLCAIPDADVIRACAALLFPSSRQWADIGPVRQQQQRHGGRVGQCERCPARRRSDRHANLRPELRGAPCSSDLWLLCVEKTDTLSVACLDI